MKIDVDQSPDPDDIAILRLELSSYNVAQVPELLDLPREDFLVLVRENDIIVAGAVCEFDWGWLYFDTVWTDEAVRGQGYGSLVMNAAENYALQQGVNSAYLFTTSFQARPFYEKIGYDCIGEQADRPLGHTFYYMVKTQLTGHAIDARTRIESPPTASNMAILDKGLLDEIAKTAPLISHKIGIFLRDDDDALCGGLVGGVFWDWFDMRYLWVDDRYRSNGWGKALVIKAEQEAKTQQCLGLICETTSFQALPFYQTLGFEVDATIEDRPPKYRNYFLQKRFNK